MIKLVVWFLALSFVPISYAFDVTPANPNPGEKLVLSGTAAPGEEVRLRSGFQMDLPVAGGKYEYEARRDNQEAQLLYL